jgi:hypothetical protein
MVAERRNNMGAKRLVLVRMNKYYQTTEDFIMERRVLHQFIKADQVGRPSRGNVLVFVAGGCGPIKLRHVRRYDWSASANHCLCVLEQVQWP